MEALHKVAANELAAAAGFKAVAVAVILGIFVALADQAPYASQASDGAVMAMTADPRAKLPPIAPPAELRAHAGEVQTHVEAF